MRRFLHLAAAVLAAPFVHGDSIRIGETVHENVLVDRGATTVYVRFPDTGLLLTVPAAGLDNDAVVTAPYAERLELRKRWDQTRSESRSDDRPPSESAATPRALPARTAASETEPTPASPPLPQGFVTDGKVPAIRLENVPLDTALRALLRAHNLDYRVEGGVVYVSTPERLREGAFEEMEVRVYDLKGLTDTLPKIVVRNTGGPGAIAAPPGTAQTGAALP